MKSQSLDFIQAQKDHAELQNQEAQQRVSALQNLLVNSIKHKSSFNWNTLKHVKPFPAFQFFENPPSYELIAQSFQVPSPKPVQEAFMPKLKQKREALETAARQKYAELQGQFEAKYAQAWQEYNAKKAAYEQATHNDIAMVDIRHQQLLNGEVEGVSWFLQKVFEILHWPEEYCTDFEVGYDATGKIAVLTMQLPSPVEVPKVIGYKYVQSRKTIEPIEMKPKEYEALYDLLLRQIALVCLHRIFSEKDAQCIQSVVFNGWVTGINAATGNEFTSCILSVQTQRETFQSIHLERVDPIECFRSLKGLIAGVSLIQLAPVTPILELNTEDKRFVESREVLASLQASDNLASMPWEDFEHLVRELIAKKYGSNGAEVHVTQASRDGGVDAIVFDKDPFRGGKFIVQAKRYNNIVPVSAVRELKGTMDHEQAVRGILVTTSHFGPDAYEFVTGKAITLIDGQNLLQMFQELGYNFRIETQRK